MISIVNAFDLSVLRCLSEHGRSSAGRIASFLNRSLSYVDTRLITLTVTGYVRSIGADPRLQKYESTTAGEAAIRRVCAEADGDTR